MSTMQKPIFNIFRPKTLNKIIPLYANKCNLRQGKLRYSKSPKNMEYIERKQKSFVLTYANTNIVQLVLFIHFLLVIFFTEKFKLPGNELPSFISILKLVDIIEEDRLKYFKSGVIQILITFYSFKKNKLVKLETLRIVSAYISQDMKVFILLYLFQSQLKFRPLSVDRIKY